MSEEFQAVPESLAAGAPEAFAGYVIGSVPVNEASPLEARARAIALRGGCRRVFIGLSPSDAAGFRADKLAAPLSGPDSTFNVRQEIFQDETHNSVFTLLVVRGLPFVLPTGTAERVGTVLDPTLLDRYVGVYRIDDTQTVSISRRGDILIGALNAGTGVDLSPESETRFFSKSANAVITFEFGPDGRVAALVLNRNGVDLRAVRLDP
jgi:hypothetical protein